MMKIKSSHKLHKSSRSSPIRKDIMKKSLHTTSMRIPTSRPPSMKRLSPGMKRMPIMPPGKSVHPPRMRPTASSPPRSVNRHTMQGSPVPMDRVRGLKRPKFEKRKMPPSPVRRPIPPSASLGMRDPSPYHDEQYLNSRSSIHGDRFSPPPMKKKVRRDSVRYEHVDDPGMSHMRRPDVSMHMDNRVSHRSEMSSHSNPMSTASHPGHHRGHIPSAIHDERRDQYEMHDRGRAGPPSIGTSGHSKRPPPIKPAYESQRGERYRSQSPPNRYPANVDKRYGPTLHERFSTVVEANRTEPKIKYSREDLEKITIDIHRNLKAQSPTLRRIVDPNDVKLVRRANEGHRPMFDREEIKQAPRDMREDAYFEKKGNSGGVYSSSHSMDLREVENYEITRHRFDPHHPAFHASSGRSLSDRWQNPEVRKDSTALDRDDREYERQPVKNYADVRRSKSGDRDFRSERYPVGETSRSRPDYPDSHRMLSPTLDSRSVPMHRRESSHPDARKKLNIRREMDRELPPSGRPDSRSRYMPLPEKRYSDSATSREKHHGDRRSPGMEPPHKWTTKRQSPSREDKLPEFSRRPDKYAYKSWSDRTDIPSRGSNYFQNDSHEGSDSYRGRGSSRQFRSPRGRPRGFRGGFPSRSTFRGGYRGSNNIRGRGGPKRGRYSPGLWEHDLYSRSSEDRKMDLP